MKITLAAILVSIIVLGSVSNAQARERGKSTPPPPPASSERIVPQPEPRAMRLGVGVASSTHITPTGSSISGWLDLGSNNSVQGYFSIGSTSPFQLSIGGTFKRTFFGNDFAGLHAGGGVGLGSVGSSSVVVSGTTVATTSTTAFAMLVSGVAGVHFGVPGIEDLLISFDGGPTFSLIDGSANFSIGAPALLGLSVYYFL